MKIKHPDVRKSFQGLNRRAFLASSLSSALLAKTAQAEVGAESLGDVAASKGILFGSYVPLRIWTNRSLDALFQQQCKMVVHGPQLFWALACPTPTETIFTYPDRIAAWAEQRGMKLRGHNLIWSLQTPKWFLQMTDMRQAEAAMVNHIRTMCTHYRGRICSWDVVNEPLEPLEGRPDGLKKSVFLERFGPEYLDVAYHTAREADPNALLAINDAFFEDMVPRHEERRRAMLLLLDRFKKNNTPLDAVGLQSHLFIANGPDGEGDKFFDQRVFANFLKEITDRGYKLMVTELDVTDKGAPGDIVARDAAVAATYKAYLDVVLDNPATTMVATWGLVDQDSWITKLQLPKWFTRPDGLKERPLLFDDNFQPKPSYHAVMAALKAAPPR